MVFQQNLLKKAYFIAKKSGPAMVRPASSDFWKAPLETVCQPKRNCTGLITSLQTKLFTDQNDKFPYLFIHLKPEKSAMTMTINFI